MDKRSRIAVSIATFNRLQGLEAVLDGIEVQDLDENIRLRVIIVDNSLDGNARGYVEKRAASYRWPLVYHNETRPGITYPRNRGIEDALECGDDFIAFTDDDVLVDSRWIRELYSVWRDTGAAAVSGTVRAKYEKEPPWWMKKGGFLEVAGLPDRQPVEYGHTTNSLVCLDCIRALGLRFDSFFSLTGGEDTSFFQAIRDAGGITVFSRDAVVHECIVPERATLGWLMRRWYRTGNTEGMIPLRSGAGAGMPLTIFFKGCSRFAAGAAGTVLTFPLLAGGRVDVFRYLRILSRGAGFISSVFGVTYEEYRDHNR